MTSHIPQKMAARAAAIAAALAIAGCSSTKLETDVPVENRPVGAAAAASGAGSGSGAGGATGTGAPQSQVASVDLSRNNPAAVSDMPRIVYFDFDSFVVKDEFRPIVEGHARALSANRSRRLTIEGHTDERGGREYNLALGQKRAEAVARSLALLGASDSQIEAVSFGKERPAVQGSDETAWARNRRAELNLR